MAQRICLYVSKTIPSAFKPNRIRLALAPGPRVIAPEVVVEEARLLIRILPRIAQVELHLRDARGARVRCGVDQRETALTIAAAEECAVI
jgi:hypothetical protein